MNPKRNRTRVWMLALLPLAAACTDRAVTLPNDQGPAPAMLPKLSCTVMVREGTMRCVDATPATRARADKVLGGQDVYVRLTSTPGVWDAGTEVLSSNVSVQNMLYQSIGTNDGSNVAPVQVFFESGPTTTVGTGEVTLVGGADGSGTFTATNQPYYQYSQIIAPYEISAPRQWQFNVPATVTTFVFTVFVNAPVANNGPQLLDRVWTGVTSTLWSLGSNWQGGAPDSASTVAIPPASQVTSGNFPVLDADAMITNLDVGTGSTLGLGTRTLTTWGNVDVLGTISNGTLWSRGTSVVLGGSVNALIVSGSASLQRATVATGAVSVSDGKLNVKDQTLTIQIP